MIRNSPQQLEQLEQRPERSYIHHREAVQITAIGLDACKTQEIYIN